LQHPIIIGQISPLYVLSFDPISSFWCLYSLY